MTKSKKHTLLWLAAGLLFSLMVLLIVWTGLSGMVWITDQEGIPKTADAVMNSIHTGDWTAFEAMVAGRPSLSPAAGDKDSAERMIWEAYLKSLQWLCSEEFNVQGSTVTQKISIICLDIRGVTDAIAVILSNSDVNTVDSEKQAQLLLSAAKQVLDEEPPVMHSEIILTFQQEKGQWMLVPNNALRKLLSGFTAH